MTEYPDFEPKIDCFTDADKFLTAARKEYYQLIFLEVELPEQQSGIELAKVLRQDDRYLYAEFVFITSHPEYALELYEVGAHHFIHKGENQAVPLKSILSGFLRRLPGGNEEVILLKNKVIPLSGVACFECQGHLVLIHYQGRPAESVRIPDSFQTFCERLASRKFVQIGQSYCVNLHHIKALQKDNLILQNGEQLPVSRPFRARLKELLQEESI